jgi:apolipoprotein N-acyltransferase
VDTFLAALLPDGNWGSLAYTQTPFLPIMQTASLFGTAGVVFLVCLVPSTLAVAIVFGRRLRRAGLLYGATLALVGGAVAFGAVRLRQPIQGRPTTFGLVAIDDAIGPRASASYMKSIWDAYDRQIEVLGKQGAEIIVLPEKIGLVSPEVAQQWQRHLSALAASHNVWIEAGAAVFGAGSQANVSWLFVGDGSLAATYQKHHLAPPERHALPPTIAGTTYTVQAMAGRTYGLAICKDMHFASLGRVYGLRGVSTMLVPAWDFGLDGWLEARTTSVRGVENGYGIVRCAREGLMTVSDAYGRVVAEAPSGPLPGKSLLVTTNVAAQLPVLYTQVGNLFGWICVAAAAGFLVFGRGAGQGNARERGPG